MQDNDEIWVAVVYSTMSTPWKNTLCCCCCWCFIFQLEFYAIAKLWQILLRKNCLGYFFIFFSFYFFFLNWKIALTKMWKKICLWTKLTASQIFFGKIKLLFKRYTCTIAKFLCEPAKIEKEISVWLLQCLYIELDSGVTSA